jgi:predicted amidophosphoribosyltransferase
MAHLKVSTPVSPHLLQMSSMQLSEVKRRLDRFGFGWIFGAEEEIQRIELIETEPIPLTGNFDLGFALGEYSMSESTKRKRTRVGDLLHKFKYEQDQHAGELLADLASDFINSQVFLKSSNLMLAVPPSFKSRAFDPVSFLAKRIEERTRISWEKGVFKRTRLTRPQKSILDPQAKWSNISDTFRLTKPQDIEGEKVLLIDDIYDSRATLNEITAILRQSKADKISVLVLAKTGFV